MRPDGSERNRCGFGNVHVKSEGAGTTPEGEGPPVCSSQCEVSPSIISQSRHLAKAGSTITESLDFGFRRNDVSWPSIQIRECLQALVIRSPCHAAFRDDRRHVSVGSHVKGRVGNLHPFRRDG